MSTTSARILIVDDEESIRELLGAVCQREGHQVTLAATGQEALRALAIQPFQLAVVDLRLPDMHGLEIVRRACQIDRHLPVLVLTGFAEFDTAVEAMRLGAYDYIPKDSLHLQLIPIIVRRALTCRALTVHNEQLIGDLQAANRELATHRDAQIRSIQQMGRALAGGLQYHDVAQMMVQGALSAIHCDGAGVLLLAPDGPRKPVAILSARGALAAAEREALLQALLSALPAHLRSEPGSVEAQVLAPELPEPLAGPWQQIETAALTVRDSSLGAMVIASLQPGPPDEDTLAVLRILVSQGSIALENAYLFARMCELATRDSLTGLYNHSHFHELLEAEISRSERHGSELAVIMIDLDRGQGLKFINDTYGHQVGDSVLREVASLLALNVRLADSVARYGGDEFVVLAPETGKKEALIVANRLCHRIHETPFPIGGAEFHVTASVGVAIFRPRAGLTANAVVDMADQGMYLAKEQGGDQVFMVDWD